MSEFQVNLDASAALARLDGMVGKLDEMRSQMPHEFLAWQSEDMNRTRPTITGGGMHFVETVIYPRARASLVTSAQRSKARRRRVVRAAGRRLILRPELFAQLRARMRALLDTVSWR